MQKGRNESTFGKKAADDYCEPVVESGVAGEAGTADGIAGGIAGEGGSTASCDGAGVAAAATAGECPEPREGDRPASSGDAGDGACGQYAGAYAPCSVYAPYNGLDVPEDEGGESVGNDCYCGAEDREAVEAAAERLEKSLLEAIDAVDGFVAAQSTDDSCPFGEEIPPEPPADYSTLDLDDPKQVGRLGEDLAVRYLRGHGYKIIKRNYRCIYGEADIICWKDGSAVLVEVKTRRGEDAFPEEAVDRAKIARYRKICLHFLLDNEAVESARFDVIGVNIVRMGMARMHHLVGVCEWES